MTCKDPIPSVNTSWIGKCFEPGISLWLLPDFIFILVVEVGHVTVLGIVMQVMNHPHLIWNYDGKHQEAQPPTNHWLAWIFEKKTFESLNLVESTHVQQLFLGGSSTSTTSLGFTTIAPFWNIDVQFPTFKENMEPSHERTTPSQRSTVGFFDNWMLSKKKLVTS